MQPSQQQQPAILPQLRERTKSAHERLEQYVDMPRRVGEAAGYRALLEAFLGWYEPLEQRLQRLGGWEGTGYCPDERAKAGWLAADLRALGISAEAVAALPRCADLPAVGSLAEGWGCAYVMEGATLGGRMITELLRGHVPEEARTFFRSYGAGVRERWLEFLAGLESFASQSPASEALLQAAVDTFSSLERWLRERDLAPQISKDGRTA